MEEKNFITLLNVYLTLRRETGLNQYKLAQRLGVNDSLLNKWLKGRRTIPPDMRERLIAELGIKETYAKLSAPANLEAAS